MTWIPVTTARAFESSIGFDMSMSERHLDEVMAVVAEVAGTDGFIEQRTVYPDVPPGTLGYLATRSQYFFNFNKCRPLWGDAMVAAAVYSMTSNGFASFAVASIRKVTDSYTKLNDDEAEVAHEIIRQSKGRAYDYGADESSIVASWYEAKVNIDEIISSLILRDIVVRSPAGRLLLVF